MSEKSGVTRRDFLKVGGFSLAGLAGVAGLRGLAQAQPAPTPDHSGHTDPVYSGEAASAPAVDDHSAHMDHGGMGILGQVDHAANGFDPHEILYDFDYGVVTEENGRTVRTWTIYALDYEFEIAPGIMFPGWLYGSTTSAASRRAGKVIPQCPGPTLRCVEGDLLRLVFGNGGSHPHTIHFHGIHSARIDGVPGAGPGMIQPGEFFTYEFEARPFGCHLYHCHAVPLKRHIHKGLYGAFIIDPDPNKYSGEEAALARARNHNYPECQAINEMVMVLNGFDTNFDGENEVYAANTVAFAYGAERPIAIRGDQSQRLYMVNIVEFDPINSIHLHANFFDYYDHGTTLRPTLTTVDTIMQCQAQRGILEFNFRDFEPGMYMFHAHQTELAELGWMGFFDVS
jgi:FtsP/CotA-like multicopper oxidase with cupredoxin domain